MDIAGLIVAIIALLATLTLWWAERQYVHELAARQDAAELRQAERMNAYIEGTLQLQDKVTRVIESQARAAIPESLLAGPPDVAVVQARRAVLDARLDDPSRGPLEVTNRGPGDATLLNLEVLGDPSALVGGQDIGDGYDLPAGTSVTFVVAVSMATPSPLTVRVTWQDGNGVDSRDIRV